MIFDIPSTGQHSSGPAQVHQHHGIEPAGGLGQDDIHPRAGLARGCATERVFFSGSIIEANRDELCGSIYTEVAVISSRTMSRGRVLFGAVLVLGAAAASSGEWPQWRGPNRDGSVAAPPQTGVWPEELTLLWRRNVGEGYSGPIISGDGLWVHTRRAGKEVVSRLRLSTGETVWSEQYDAPFEQNHSALAHGRGPYSTPAPGRRPAVHIWREVDSVCLGRRIGEAAVGGKIRPRTSITASLFLGRLRHRCFGMICALCTWAATDRGPIEAPAEGAMVAAAGNRRPGGMAVVRGRTGR